MASDEPRVATWVPQVFFDLIARVVPGIITIGAVVVASYGPSRVLSSVEHWLQDPPEGSPAILIILLVLTVSYAFSIVLWGLWCLVVAAVRRVRRVAGVELETGVEDPEGEFPIQYDFIKQKDPQAGNRITKLKAEIHLSAVLVVGLSAALLVDLVRVLVDPSIGRMVFGGLVALATLGSASSWRFFVRRTQTAVKNQCRLLGYGEWCSENQARQDGRSGPFGRDAAGGSPAA